MSIGPHEHVNEVASSNLDRIGHTSEGKLDFNPHEVKDIYATPYEHRQLRLPQANVMFESVPGESLAIPNPNTEVGSKAKELLDRLGLKGIEYIVCYPIFDPVAQESVHIDMTDNLYINYKNADSELAKKWSDESKFDKDDWTPRDIAEYRNDHQLTWHESQDLTTCQLIPRAIHECFLHDGGRCEYMFKHQIQPFGGIS